MKRRPLLVGAAFAALAVFVAGMALVPSIQRRALLAWFPSDAPRRSLAVDSFHVTPTTVRLRSLDLAWDGMRIRAESVELRFRPLQLLLSRRAILRDLSARGLEIDLRERLPGAEVEPASVDSFRFTGTRGFATLPLRVVADHARVEARVLLRAPEGFLCLDAVLEGGGLEPGATGDLEAEIRLRHDSPTGHREILEGHGSLSVRESRDGVLEAVAFHGDVRPGSDAGGKQGLAARAAVDLTSQDEERYTFMLATTGASTREVFEVVASYDPVADAVSGSWTSRLVEGQVDAYLQKLAPPGFALDGSGTLRWSPDSGALDIAGSFDASAADWSSVHPRLVPAGPLRFHGEAEVRLAGPVLSVRDLNLGVGSAGGSEVLRTEARQPFDVDWRARTLTPSRWSEPCLSVRASEFPLAWTGAAGGTLGGAIDLMWSAPGQPGLETAEPLAVAGLRVRTEDGRDFGPIRAQTSLSAHHDADRWRLHIQGFEADLATGAHLEFEGSAEAPVVGRLVASLDGKLAARLPRLSQIVDGLDTLKAEGRFSLDVPAATLAVQSVEVKATRAEGGSMLEGKMLAKVPLEVDLRDGTMAWDRFEPENLTLEVDAFPLRAANRFLPQVRMGAGTLHGRLEASVDSEREVTIRGDHPFEIRGADIYLGEARLVSSASLRVEPLLRLNRNSAEIRFENLAFRDDAGDRFDGSIRLLAAPRRGSPLEVEAQFALAAPSVTTSIGRLGEFRARLNGTLDLNHDLLRIASAAFDCRDLDDRSYFEGESLQPFRVALDSFRIEPEGADTTLFRATFVPLEIERIFPKALGFSLSGSLPSGQATVVAVDGGLQLLAAEPLRFGPVQVTRNDVPVLDGVRFSFMPGLTYAAEGIRTETTRIEIDAGGHPLASVFLAARFDFAGEPQTRSAETRTEIDLPTLFAQPAGRGHPGFSAGHLTYTRSVRSQPEVSTTFRLGISGAVARHVGPLPDLDLGGTLSQEADGVFRFDAPIRVVAGDRISDLDLRGTVERGDASWGVDGEVTSQRLVLDDLLQLVEGFTPAPADADAEAPASSQAAFPADRPFWERLQVRLPITLGSVEFDRYALTGVGGRLEVDDTSMGLRDIAAEFLGARLSASVGLTFDPSPVGPYAFAGSASVENVDLGRIFLAVTPGEPPVLEGRFGLRCEAQGRGRDPGQAVLGATAHLEAEGSNGVFRGLAEGSSDLSRLLKVAGTLTFSKEIRAAGRAVSNLEAVPIHSARLQVERVAGKGLEVQELSVEAPNVRLGIEGTIERTPEQPFVTSGLDARISLQARGDVGILFDATGFLAPGAEGDYREVTRRFLLKGTVGDPDASDVYRAIVEAGANARGTFGWALRKAGRILAEE